jgi:hypothetical protein
MMQLNKKYACLIKVVAIVVVFFFSVNTLALSYPDQRIHRPEFNLQVQSVFNPILKEVGWRHQLQIRLEFMYILGMSLKLLDGETVPAHDINANLDEWVNLLPDADHDRILKVIRHPELSPDGSSVKILMGFLDDSTPRPLFLVTASCLGLGEIENIAKHISIEVIPAIDYDSISWPQEPQETGRGLEDINNTVNYIRDVVSVISNMGSQMPSVWSVSEITGKVKKVTLEEWLSHGSMMTFATLTNGAVSLSGYDLEGSLVDTIVGQYEEYRLKIDELLLVIQDAYVSQGLIEGLPEVNWTRENPASRDIALPYLMKDLLSCDTGQKVEIFKKAINLIEEAMDQMEEYIEILSNKRRDSNKISDNTGSVERAGSTVPEGIASSKEGYVTRPMLRIPAEDVRNILIFSDINSKQIPKIGEMVIELWALVTSVHKRYPEANIYVTSSFPGIFMVKQFGGKIKVIPRSEKDVRRWGYDPDEWRGDGYADIFDFVKGKDTRVKFIAEKKIDMVIDSSLVPFYFKGLSGEIKKYLPGAIPPHVFSMPSVMSMASAQSPGIWDNVKDIEYEDRNGNVSKVSGLDHVVADAAPGSRFKKAGIWELRMGMCRMLGLDVDKDNITTIRLDVEEAVGALSLLKEWFYSVNADFESAVFDPSKKIIVVNVYAVTHQSDILDKTRWIGIIKELIKNIDNAYFVFTHGGEMDMDYFYVNEVVQEIRAAGSDVLMPRADIYPVINDILGISSGLVTLDTGLSHIGSAVYGIPSAIITTRSILHWLTPGDNAYPIVMDESPEANLNYLLSSGFQASAEDIERVRMSSMSSALETIREYAAYINATPERPAAMAAKAAAASATERGRMDKELYDQRIEVPDISTELRTYISAMVEMLGVDRYLSEKGIPPDELFLEVAVVDSVNQTGVGIPRFNAKLYTPENRKEVLLIDKSCLEKFISSDGKENWRFKDGFKEEEVLHEIFGHMLARQVFAGITEGRNKPLSDPDRKLMAMEEEFLAHFMTLVAMYVINKTYGSPITSDLLRSWGIDPSRIDVWAYIRAITLHIESTVGPERVSLFRYREMLEKQEELGNVIEKDIINKYLAEIRNIFSLDEKDFQPGSDGRGEPPVARSFLADFNDSPVWKILTYPSTFFHELGHYIWGHIALKFGAAEFEPLWSWGDVFLGETHNVYGSARTYGGLTGNVAGILLGLALISKADILPMPLSLSYFALVVSIYLFSANLTSLILEVAVGMIGWGGDLGGKEAAGRGDNRSSEKFFDDEREYDDPETVETIEGPPVDMFYRDDIGEMEPMTLEHDIDIDRHRYLDVLSEDGPALRIRRNGNRYQVSDNPKFSSPTLMPEVIEAYVSILQKLLDKDNRLAEFMALNYDELLGHDAMSDLQRVFMHNRYEKGDVHDPEVFVKEYVYDVFNLGKRDLGNLGVDNLKRLSKYRKFKLEYLRRTAPESKQVVLADKANSIKSVEIVTDAIRNDPTHPFWRDRDIMLVDDLAFQFSGWRRRDQSIPGEKVVFAKWRGTIFMFYISRSHTAKGRKVHEWRNCDLVDIARRWFVKSHPENVDDLPGKLKVLLDKAIYSENIKFRKANHDYFYGFMGKGDPEVGIDDGVNMSLLGKEGYKRLEPVYREYDTCDEPETAETLMSDTYEYDIPGIQDPETQKGEMSAIEIRVSGENVPDQVFTKILDLRAFEMIILKMPSGKIKVELLDPAGKNMDSADVIFSGSFSDLMMASRAACYEQPFHQGPFESIVNRPYGNEMLGYRITSDGKTFVKFGRVEKFIYGAEVEFGIEDGQWQYWDPKTEEVSRLATDHIYHAASGTVERRIGFDAAKKIIDEDSMKRTYPADLAGRFSNASGMSASKVDEEGSAIFTADKNVRVKLSATQDLRSIKDREEKKIENAIKKVFPVAQRLLRGRGTDPGVEDYLVKNRDVPIDIIMDVSLIPEGDLAAVAQTWSYLILLCRELDNVNFTFRNFYSEDDLDEKAISLGLGESLKYVASEKAMLALIQHQLKSAAIRLGIGDDAEKLISGRLNSLSRADAIEIPICSQAWLKWIDGQSRGGYIDSNQYPVAMEGVTAKNMDEISLRDYHSALMVGLVVAAMAIAEKRGELKELIDETRLVDNMNAMYKSLPFEKKVPITADTLKAMVSPSLSARIRLAIELALPPIVRGAIIKQLQGFHENMQLALMAA